ncbi:MAG TPA: response regulator [Gammaproteobacteria bacterium]|nr:response regulator [Gammaproteobacteria bacterium]
MFSALLVEDNENFRQMLSDVLLLRFSTIDVQVASDGKDALSKIGDLHPDIILMDIHLPGENGLELTRKIKQVHTDIVVVILTGHDLPEYRQRAFRNGADCFIPKSSDTCMEDVMARIEGAMTSKQQTLF